MTQLSGNDRLMELLADHATVGLREAEQEELDRHLAGVPQFKVSFELAAAAAHLAMSPPMLTLPGSLERSLVREADDWVTQGERIQSPAKRPHRMPAWPGWLAAAACLTLAAAAWLGRPGEKPINPEALATRPGTIVAPWGDFNALDDKSPPEIKGVQGDVVWNEDEQRGYMRFVGLPVNDPAKEQYQVWLVDARGLGQRISGAVFNSSSARECIVPIDPAIRTDGVSIFAVTIERPGGTWVSDMKRRVCLAVRRAS
jgi:hypothetical protein